MVRQAPVICVMVPPIHLGAWSMALMLWLPFELKGQTCYVIHRVETDSKLSDFERIFSLYTLLHILHTLPVFILENCIVV